MSLHYPNVGDIDTVLHDLLDKVHMNVELADEQNCVLATKTKMLGISFCYNPAQYSVHTVYWCKHEPIAIRVWRVEASDHSSSHFKLFCFNLFLLIVLHVSLIVIKLIKKFATLA